MLDELTIEHCRKWTEHYKIIKYTEDTGVILYTNGKKVCLIYKEVDGYWVADQFGSGAYEGPHLIALGFILLELNEAWDKEVKAGLEAQVETYDKDLGLTVFKDCF